MQTLPQKIIQTTENTRFVFASTDTTAIYSFVIAAFIGIILALLGVFLAWWYGKKSFDLTSKSFEVTVKQILASIDSARENTDKAFRMNQELIINQQRIQHRELNFRFMHEWVQTFDILVSEYFGEVFSYIKLINSYIMKDELALADLDKKWDNFNQTMKNMDVKSQNISKLKLKLLLLLNKNTELENEIIGGLEFMDSWLREDYIVDCFARRIAIESNSKNYVEFLSITTKCKENILKLRNRETSEQLQNDFM